MVDGQKRAPRDQLVEAQLQWLIQDVTCIRDAPGK